MDGAAVAGVGASATGGVSVITSESERRRRRGKVRGSFSTAARAGGAGRLGWLGYDVLASCSEWMRAPPVMELHSESLAAAAAAADWAVTMDAEVWSKMPEELIWEVLRFLPAANLFQLQLVSRKWRQELTSATFRTRVIRLWAEQQGRGGAVACVRLRHGRASRSRSSSSRNSSVEVLDMDLSFVPSSFWRWADSGRRYSVAAAAHGLVLLCSEKPRGDPRDNQYCVLNPLTRTCIVIEEHPWQQPGRLVAEPLRWFLPTSTVVAVVAETVAGTDGGACSSWDLDTCVVATRTYDLARRRWTSVVHIPQWEWWSSPVTTLLGSESFWYLDRARRGARVQVMAPAAGPRPGRRPRAAGAGAGGQVKVVASMAAPSVTLLGLDAAATTAGALTPKVLVTHRGAVFLVAQLAAIATGAGHGEPPPPPLRAAVCGVWRLARERMEWEGVARLDAAEVERLTGTACGRGGAANAAGVLRLRDAYGVRELLCCQLENAGAQLVGYDHGGDHPYVWSPEWVLGFNLDTGHWEMLHEWEMLHSHDQAALMSDKVTELRPDLFLPDSAASDSHLEPPIASSQDAETITSLLVEQHHIN